MFNLNFTKMKKSLFIVVATAMALGSCSKNEVDQSYLTADNNAINFGVYTGQATKGTVMNDAGLKTSGFGVFGFYTEDTDYAGTIAPNFMYNTKVSYNSSAWTYSPMKYWSEHNSDKYTFLAYAPYSNNAQITVTDNTKAPAITVTVPTDVKKMVDFVADARVDVKSGTDQIVNNTGDDADAVQFTMQHEMTRVAIQLKSDVDKDSHGEGNTTIVVKKIEFGGTKFHTTGVYSFAANNTDRGAWTLSTTGTLVPETPKTNTAIQGYAAGQGIAVANNSLTSTNLFGLNQYLFLLPPNGTTGVAAEDATIKLTYDIVTEDTKLEDQYTASKDNVKTVKVPAGSLAQGVAYNYTLTFSMNEVKLSATVDSTGWGTEDGITVEGGTEE